MSKVNKTIALSFIEGRVVRDLFENGFLDMLREQGVEVVCFTPAERVPDFKNKWLPHVKAIEFHPMYKINGKEQRLFKLREKAKKIGDSMLKTWMNLEYKLYDSDEQMEQLLKKYNCSMLLITHPTHSFEMSIYKAARKLGLPIVGILRSWDNIHKGLRLRPDYLTVWNPVNKQEAIDHMKLEPDSVRILGGSQFDEYFSDEVKNSTREIFARKFNLDPNRPIITLATLGSFLHLYDENYLVDYLVELIQQGKISNNPQLIIRLHPTTKLEYMLKYLEHDFVRLSYITGYIPTIGWTMTSQEVREIGMLMKYSDVVISPGSTITIETAIFDTPTIVPVFHHYQPGLGQEMFGYHFATHFKRLQDKDMVPFVYKKEELAPMINRCIADKSYYADKRKKLADDYIHFFDGKSTERIAEFVAEMANK